MKCIYVAGPIGVNDNGRLDRVRAALDVADKIWSAGLWPFVPHLCHYWDQHRPRHYEDWMLYDRVWLRRCDALYRMPGESPGAEREVLDMRRLGRPVFFDMEALCRWAKGVAE